MCVHDDLTCSTTREDCKDDFGRAQVSAELYAMTLCCWQASDGWNF